MFSSKMFVFFKDYLRFTDVGWGGGGRTKPISKLGYHIVNKSKNEKAICVPLNAG